MSLIFTKNRRENNKTSIGFTLGDLGGIGLEIYNKFLEETKTDHKLHELFEFVLIDNHFDYKSRLKDIEFGKASKLSGQHAYEVLKKANELALKNEIDFLITGPVAKESLWLAGHQVSGQTELLAKLNNLNRDQIEMFFVLDEFRTVLATRHVPLKDVPQILEERLAYVLKNSSKALKEVFGIENPKIAVAGLNPHAGENGIIGFEEKRFMTKVMDDFAHQNPDSDLKGPFSADALFALAAQKYMAKQPLDYDLYLAAYHDQILPLIKGLGGLRAINLTVGMPYLRLSVDHGTGFDIVGKNIASPEGFISCVKFCQMLQKDIIASY